MERKKISSVGDVLKKWVDKMPNAQNEIDATKIPILWKEVVGQAINDSTQSIFVEKNRLIVKFSNSIARHEVLLMKSSILYEINGKIGRKFLTQLIIR